LNLLFLIPYTPTLIRTRSYNLLLALAHRGHDITLATLWENQEDRQALGELETLGIKVISAPLTRPRILLNLAQAFLTGVPLQSRYSWNPTLARSLEFEILNSNFEIIHVEHLRGALYGLHLQSTIRNSQFQIPLVWDSVDCISLLFEQSMRASRSSFGRWVTRFELPRTRRFEAQLVNSFDSTLVTSLLDQQAFQRLNVKTFDCTNVEVLPNGVDLSYFTPDDTPHQSDCVVFTGKLSYHANMTAACFLLEEIMPRVWEQRPQVQVQLVGKDPPPKLRRLAASQGNVQVTGSVPDIRPYLRGATLSVAPLIYGAGIQNKVLEAMACGTPVVASTQAVSALSNLIPGKDLLIADGPAATAEEVLRLLEDPNLRNRIGTGGLAYVRRYHDWNNIAAQLESIYSNVIVRTAKLSSQISH
jgi:glycosyltransferase involved in cell wall biosynthesis